MKQFTGSDTISEMLASYGKITDDNAKRTITLTFEVTSTKSEVAAGANVSKVDEEKALLTLSDEHRAVIEAYKATASNFAKLRVTGKKSDRWKSIVQVDKVKALA